ncbi:autophagy-related protein 9A-like, partial [Pezoporus wallicus]|uniref:autophagy-related protein 9A-like n=1 Tax=Pezoporus wallicus TaxID=35540 RepID=UPI00254AFE93
PRLTGSAPRGVSAHFETQYQRLESSSTESPPGGGDLLVHVPEGAKSPWHHIENLDLFFSRISFHRAGGTHHLLGSQCWWEAWAWCDSELGQRLPLPLGHHTALEGFGAG